METGAPREHCTWGREDEREGGRGGEMEGGGIGRGSGEDDCHHFSLSKL
jgi:hypothetical protein